MPAQTALSPSMHDGGVVARTGSGHGRTVGGELSAAAIGTHVALDAEARGRNGQTHIVKLADDAFRPRDVCEVGSAQDTGRSPHGQTGSIRDAGVDFFKSLINCTFVLNRTVVRGLFSHSVRCTVAQVGAWMSHPVQDMVDAKGSTITRELL
jgi:hypothetical protein